MRAAAVFLVLSACGGTSDGDASPNRDGGGDLDSSTSDAARQGDATAPSDGGDSSRDGATSPDAVIGRDGDPADSGPARWWPDILPEPCSLATPFDPLQPVDFERVQGLPGDVLLFSDL